MANCHFIILWNKNYISGREVFFKVYDLGVSKGVLLGQSCVSNWKGSTDSSLNAPKKRWVTFSVNYTPHSLIEEKGSLSLPSVFKIWNNTDLTTQGSHALPWCFVITKETGRLEAAAHHPRYSWEPEAVLSPVFPVFGWNYTLLEFLPKHITK